MLVKIFYWLIVFLDVAALLLFFVLGLAAATSSRTSPLAVAAFMLILPGILLAASIWLFLKAQSALLRSLAFLLAAAPWLFILIWGGIETASLRANLDPQGKLTYFREGPVRELTAAIASNDAARAAELVSKVDVNARGYANMSLLTLSLRQLRATPDRLEVLRILIKAGANPNLASDETPLELAILGSPKTGPEPVQLLLNAGANPNLKNSFGTPVYFAAASKTVSLEVLKLLLDHGADLKASASQGRTVLLHAATSSNWKAALLLLERGADWRQLRDLNGRSFKELVEAYKAIYSEEPGLAEVLDYINRH